MTPGSPCPKCGSAMEEGFIVDNTHGGNIPAAWAEGKPRYSAWFGLKMKGVTQHQVITMRCEKCGFLESYAPSN